jgi:hypothetical protein
MTCANFDENFYKAKSSVELLECNDTGRNEKGGRDSPVVKGFSCKTKFYLASKDKLESLKCNQSCLATAENGFNLKSTGPCIRGGITSYV